ncbi:zinc/manganese transport system ATP-binding protein [Natronocella acetinitrilica]|uniref:Zinc/manganese transport system ATP-binding protein n=1 Tax=Natronocella acetinitrilica TaxID=414046 RepID=A0AAE3G1A4_9GAMM|nr:zinc ABC transporter ATP-binding protein AztA [Natronocella acetinitrilica]MCP1673139.1 zinc/manganese transport system ATP-binding protein [Natronocella acetinitrilica]
MTAAIQLQDLTVAYDRHPAVHHLNGNFAHGSLTAVVGPNGAGKSTLLKSIAGVLRPAQGSILRDSLRARDIAYLPQQADIDRHFPIRVMDVVSSGHWHRRGLFRGLSRDDMDKASHALAAVGLSGFQHRVIGSLSAGQFQRVLFARMLLQDAPVILLDEPFNAIDARTTADLLGVVQRWHDESRTIIAVVHDIEQVRQHFPQTLLMARQEVAWGPTQTTLTAANLLKARAMAEAWDETANVCAQGLRRG